MLFHFFVPRLCRVCGCTLVRGEEVMCLGCLMGLPRTGMHRHQFNAIHQRLGHGAPVGRAAGWFYYKKDTPYARLLVEAKYNGLHRQARALGRICAEELAAEGFFAGIDALAPMPMYWVKQLRRGYNQSHEICRGISSATGLPIVQPLRAAKSHGVLSRLGGKQARYAAISGTLAVGDADAVRGKHVLFVDDIITTGASASEAVKLLHACGAREISVLSLGLTI